jgi:type IV secretion system protein VirD4
MSNELIEHDGPQAYTPKTKASNTIPVLGVVSFLAILQCVTQFFAHEFQYQSALGAHMRQLFAPWSMLRWAGRWYAAYTDTFMRTGYVRTVTALRLIALIIARMELDSSGRRNPYLQGWARWANLKYIQPIRATAARSRSLSKLTTGKAPTGAARVYVGAWFDKRGTQYLRQNGREHDLGYAPARSGNSRTGRKLNRYFWVGRACSKIHATTKH